MTETEIKKGLKAGQRVVLSGQFLLDSEASLQGLETRQAPDASAPEKPLALSSFGLLFGRRSISGSLIGGIAETQEMLDFCGTHDITSDVEVTPIQKVNEAYARMLKGDVKYRFTIDMASLRSE